MVGEQLDQQRVLHAAVDDVGEADALVDRVGAGPELGDHALADALVRRSAREARRTSGAGSGVLSSLASSSRPGDSGQIDDLLRVHRDRDRPRRLVGVDVVRLAFGIRADGRDHRGQAVVEQAVDQLGADAA